MCLRAWIGVFRNRLSTKMAPRSFHSICDETSTFFLSFVFLFSFFDICLSKGSRDCKY